MLKKFIKPSIIGLIQAIVLVVLIGSLAPFLLTKSTTLTHYREWMAQLKGSFLILHGLFYLLLYCLWPFFIKLICQKKALTPTDLQLSEALNARRYLIAALVVFEVLNLLR